MNIEYVILIGAGIVAVGYLSGCIESGRSNSGLMIRIRIYTPWLQLIFLGKYPEHLKKQEQGMRA